MMYNDSSMGTLNMFDYRNIKLIIVMLNIGYLAYRHIVHWRYCTVNIFGTGYICNWIYIKLDILDIGHIGHWILNIKN